MLQQFYPQTTHSFRYELNKDMNFSAAHFVPSELAGKCQQMHGHTYFVNITVAGDNLDDAGFLVDFKSLKVLIHDRYDHGIMNDHAEFSNTNPEYFPTTEIVARVIWENVQAYLNGQSNRPKCIQVLVRETPTSYVVFRPTAEDIHD